MAVKNDCFSRVTLPSTWISLQTGVYSSLPAPSVISIARIAPMKLACLGDYIVANPCQDISTVAWRFYGCCDPR